MTLTQPDHPLVVGLDIGTTSIAAVAVSTSGRIVASAGEPHGAAVRDLPDGYAEQSPDAVLSAVWRCLKSIANEADGRNIIAVGVTGQMHSTVLLDDQQAAIGNIVTWQDRRSVTGPGGHLLASLQDAVPAGIRSRPGCRPSAGFMATTIYALRQLGQWPSECRHVSFVADWVVRELTNHPAVSDISHAASSGMFDLLQQTWCPDIVELTGLPPTALPEVQPSGSVVSTLSRAAAEQLGCAPEVVVCNAVGDNQASVIAALPDNPNAVLINIGTGGQIVWRSESPCSSAMTEIRTLPTDDDRPGEIADGTMIVGAGICGGDAIAWWNHTVRSWAQALGVTLSESDVWKLAGKTETSALRCQPFFRGTRQSPELRGAITGIDWHNLSPANLLNSIYEGIADAMFAVWDDAGKAPSGVPSSVQMSGNAARRHPGLVRAVSNRFGVTATVTPFAEEAAVGAAMLAGVRIGHWPSLASARDQVHRVKGSTAPPDEPLSDK